MNDNLFKKILTIRKGGENGEKYYITIGNVVLSKRLHETEEDALKEVENVDIETVSRIVIAVMDAVDKMIKDSKENQNEN